MSPTPTPTGRKRALALLKPKAKSADSPHPKTKAPKFKTKSLPLVASPRPPFSSSIASPPRPSLSSSMGSPKTPKSNNFLRRLPSLPNLRRKRSTEFNSFCQPPIGYEWVPLYHEPEHTEQVSTTEIESVQSLPIPKSYVSEPYASEPYDLVTSPDFEPSNTHPDAPETKPDTHIPDAPGTTPNTADTQSYPPDKRTRRQGRIFTPGFADALRAELECRCPTPCRDAGAFDDTQDMVAQLCAFGII
ncbi:hypothetical protein CcaverHIS631_0501920 [Cutaneotrichosporon cavernicola]|nr:hypothetical protein CcaverHIS631_0501920 [Cutaneotrichosporon cavernicola]BEJ08105.1 hypothetical protein CcaverHIS641_0501900 [Cutaneotrichosporon cavernicola]